MSDKQAVKLEESDRYFMLFFVFVAQTVPYFGDGVPVFVRYALVVHIRVNDILLAAIAVGKTGHVFVHVDFEEFHE